MTDVCGDFEVHLTVWSGNAEALAQFAERHGVKYTRIELDRGVSPNQPMITVLGRGGPAEQQRQADEWRGRLQANNFSVQRVKVEVAPWSTGVPQTDDEATGQYFEHHVKILLDSDDLPRLIRLAEVAEGQGARMSTNARRHRPDHQQERFVTQRCHGVGRVTSRQRLEELLTTLRDNDFEILEVEEEYVVLDDDLDLDEGWFTPAEEPESAYEERLRTAAGGGEGYPATYRPLPTTAGVHQRGAFDPALKQWPHAYRAGEPSFRDAELGTRWRAARQAALWQVLSCVAGSTSAASLVLRGSVLLRTWIGDAAREPGDLDFVVVPPTMIVGEGPATRLLDGIVAAVRDLPGAGLDAEGVVWSDIWTYERAPGRRLVFPYAIDDLPPGNIQLDFVFNESLPADPAPLWISPPLGISPLPGPVLAATPELSLAWKLLWLETDSYPQGKDLYDAVLLAEYTTAPLDLVHTVLRKELGPEADGFAAASVLRWNVDWDNFRDEYPEITGDRTHWLRRLALALDRAWRAP